MAYLTYGGFYICYLYHIRYFFHILWVFTPTLPLEESYMILPEDLLIKTPGVVSPGESVAKKGREVQMFKEE